MDLIGKWINVSAGTIFDDYLCCDETDDLIEIEIFFIIIPNQTVCDRMKLCMLETICDKFELNSLQHNDVQGKIIFVYFFFEPLNLAQ